MAKDKITKYANELLNEREETHGSFTQNARTFQNLRLEMFFREENPAILPQYTAVQEAALTQILFKLSRIKQNPSILDHWKDLGGYADLVVKDMEF